MSGFLSTYLAYNVIVGIILSVIRLAKNGTKGSVRNWLLLLLFPAVGLGYMKFQDEELNQGTPDYPENWFMWTYMKKINWGFLLLQIGGLVAIILFASFGSLLGFDDFLSQARDPLEAGLGILLGMGIIVMFFAVLMGFGFVFMLEALILIYLPNSQIRNIERRRMQDILREQHQPESKKQASNPITKPVQLFQDVHIYVLSCLHEFNSISSSRKKELEDVARYISQKLKQQETVNLIFICTHNSRRSQLAQVWAAVAAANYGVRNVHCFSGGTEETSFAKRAVETLKQAGFKIDGTVGTNPRYAVRYSDEVGALDCFSKKYDHAANPQKGFAALMTCSDADVNCPFVPGAEVRYKLTYEDPKLADRTPQEAEVYEARSKQIATEMLYLFSHVG